MSRKSYKREVAFGLLALWTVLVINVFWFTHDAAELIAKGTILQGITVWIIPPVLFVFFGHSYINKDKE